MPILVRNIAIAFVIRAVGACFEIESEMGWCSEAS